MDIEQMTPAELKAEITQLLHLLWGHCKESPEYNKSAWTRFSQCLDKQMADVPKGKGP